MTEAFYSPYEPPSLPPPPAPASAWIAWMVILASVIPIFIFSNWIGPRQRGTSAPITQAAESAGEQLRASARFALGMKALSTLAESAQKQGNAPAKTDYVEMVRQVAVQTPADRIRQIIMLAELSEKSTPEELLDEVETQKLSPGLREDVQSLRIIYTKGRDELDPKERERLISRYGWYGHVALAYGKPTNDEQRRIATTPAVRAVLAGTIFFLLAVAAFLLGIVLLIVAGVRLKNGKLRPAFVPPQSPPYALLEGFAAYMGVFTGVSFILRYAHARSEAWDWVVLGGSVAAGLAWPMLRGVSWGQIVEQIGWRRGNGLVNEAAAGFAGFIASVPLSVVAIIVTLFLSRFAHHLPTHPIQHDIRPGPRLIYVYFMACVWAPIFEETFFRGMFFSYMRGVLRWLASAIIISLIFAMIHPQGWTAIPALGTIAMTLAALREWRGSLVASMTAHALNNFVAITIYALVFI